MPHLYSLDCLIPISVHSDQQGVTNAVYRLPAPKQWWFRRLEYGPGRQPQPRHSREPVYKVRVCLYLAPSSQEPLAIVIPFGRDGQESFGSTVTFSGVVSMVGVLARLGFTPLLAPN